MKIILDIAGSIILIYLGLINAKEFFHKAAITENPSRRMFNSPFITGYVLAISSPMTIVWWTGVFGALLAIQADTPANISAFFSCFFILLGCFLWVFFLATALHWGKKIINEKITGYISLIAGIFLIGFGIYFLHQAYILLLR